MILKKTGREKSNDQQQPELGVQLHSAQPSFVQRVARIVAIGELDLADGARNRQRHQQDRPRQPSGGDRASMTARVWLAPRRPVIVESVRLPCATSA